MYLRGIGLGKGLMARWLGRIPKDKAGGRGYEGLDVGVVTSQRGHECEAKLMRRLFMCSQFYGAIKYQHGLANFWGRYENVKPKVYRGTLPFDENQEPRSDE